VPTPAGVIVRPRRSLAAINARPRLAAAAAIVAGSGAVSIGFDWLAAELAPRSFPPPSPYLFVALPAVLLAFWVLAGWLIDLGARMMARPSRLRQILASAGHCFVLLSAYGLISALQALALRLGAGGQGAWWVGWLDAPLLAWFIVLLGLAVATVHRLEAPSALALALLPFGALLGALVLYALVAGGIAGLHPG